MPDIAPRSSDVASDSFLIFATDVLPEVTCSILKTNNIPFRVLSGRYAGIDEVSYIVNAKHHPELSAKFGTVLWGTQESVLILGPIDDLLSLRPAILHYWDESEQFPDFLGYFQEASKDEAENALAFTFDPEEHLAEERAKDRAKCEALGVTVHHPRPLGRYYVCKPVSRETLRKVRIN